MTIKSRPSTPALRENFEKIFRRAAAAQGESVLEEPLPAEPPRRDTIQIYQNEYKTWVAELNDGEAFGTGYTPSEALRFLAERLKSRTEP